MVEFIWAGQLKKGSNKEMGLALSKSKLAKTIFGKLFGFQHFCFKQFSYHGFLIVVFLYTYISVQFFIETEALKYDDLKDVTIPTLEGISRDYVRRAGDRIRSALKRQQNKED